MLSLSEKSHSPELPARIAEGLVKDPTASRYVWYVNGIVLTGSLAYEEIVALFATEGLSLKAIAVLAVTSLNPV